MTGRQIDLINWYCQQLYNKPWNEVVKDFAQDHLDRAIVEARNHATSTLTIDDLMHHLENPQNDELQIPDAT